MTMTAVTTDVAISPKLLEEVVSKSSGECISPSIPGYFIRSYWVRLDKHLADEFLLINTSNRNVRARHLDKLIHDTVNGEMITTHQGIGIDEEGHMCDGQHRCWMVSMTGIPIWVMVTIGLSVDAKNRIDSPAIRRAADFQPGPHSSNRSSAARIIEAVRRLDGEISVYKLQQEMARTTNADIQTIMQNPGVGDLMLKYAKSAASAAQSVMTVGPGGLLASATIYPDVSQAWLDGLSSGVGLEAGDARIALTKYRPSVRASNRTRIQTPEAAFIALKAVTFFARGRKMHHMRWTRDETLVVPVP